MFHWQLQRARVSQDMCLGASDRKYDDQIDQLVNDTITEIQKDLRWHYVGIKRNFAIHQQLIPLSKLQKAMMDDFKLWRHQMISWLHESSLSVWRVSASQRYALDYYCGNGFEYIWQAYQQDGKKDAMDVEFAAFDSIFRDTTKMAATLHIPASTIVFEGQGLHAGESDLCGARLGAVIERKRPSSTSWNLNAALWFADQVLVVHEIVMDHNVSALNVQGLHTASFGAEGWLECEVLLEPGLRIEVVGETQVPLDGYHKNRSLMPTRSPCVMRVIFTRVRKL